ncbi:MAG: O-methyltransferase [Ignavibacteria bacterium]|nr:O-methyltransferase [Ignavibacteria bacterium]
MKGVPLNEELYEYIVNTFVTEDDVLKSVTNEAEKKNIPLIQVSPENGKFLFILLKMIKARSVLEIGTLTGYSAIWMARALPDNGKLITLEVSKEHAREARENFRKAKLDKIITLIEGEAMESLEKLGNERFDFVFIDADKENSLNYYEKVFNLVNPGGIIATDNTLRDGKIISNYPDSGTRALQLFNKHVANDERVYSLLVPISDGLTICLKK